MEVLKVVLATILSALTLFVIAKIIGHKQVAQFDFFDYITGITIGSIAAELATTLDKPWWKPTISMIVFGIITAVLGFITRKIPRSRKYINGTPTIIMSNGKLYRKNMKKAKLELSEFLLLCRQSGFFNLSDINTAVFEYNGKISFLPVSTKRPVNPADMNLSPQPDNIYTEVIMDGRIIYGNIKRRGLNETWLNNELKAQGYKDSKEIFLGVVSSDNKLTLYPN